MARGRLKPVLALLILTIVGPVLVVACGRVNISSDWRSADRSPQAIALPAAADPDAVVQVYAARAFHWRGIFAVHTWIATKPAGAPQYTVHEVLGWRERRGEPVVVSSTDFPDRSWYGNPPELLREVRGAAATALIPQIEAAVADYPYRFEYTLWPGPNSNTFVAHVARAIPELGVVLPTTAIGKDFLAGGRLVDRAPSGTGWQLSIFGLAGVTLARNEGIEVNILSANFALGLRPFAIRLPGIDRLVR